MLVVYVSTRLHFLLFLSVLSTYIKKCVTPAAASHILFTTSLDCIISRFNLMLFYKFSVAKCTVLIKSIVMYSMSQVFTVTHHSLTDPPRTTSSPTSSSHGKCPIQVCDFLSFVPHFYCTFSTFIYPNTTLCYSCLQYSVQ